MGQATKGLPVRSLRVQPQGGDHFSMTKLGATVSNTRNDSERKKKVRLVGDSSSGASRRISIIKCPKKSGLGVGSGILGVRNGNESVATISGSSIFHMQVADVLNQS